MFSKLKSKLSIYSKLRLIMMRVLFISFLLLFILLTAQNIYKSYQNEHDQLQMISEVLVINLNASLLYDDSNTAQKTLDALALGPSPIKYANLLDNNKDIFASYGEMDIADDSLWRTIDHYHPVMFDGVRVGELYIIADLSRMWHSIYADLATLAFVLIGSLFLAIFLIRDFAATIVEPIKKLAETSRIITRTAKYRIRTEKVSDDEVGQLTDTVNEMLDLIEMRDGELRIAATAFNTQEAIIIMDTDKNIVRVNPAFTKITGYDFDDIEGERPLVLQLNQKDKQLYRKIDDEITKEGSWQGELIDTHKNGFSYPANFMITVVKNSSDVITNYVMTFTDISERVAAEEEIRHLAFYDALTQLPNRRLLIERLKSALTTSDRHHHYGALFFLDIDKFKILNDTKGHHYGDMLLIEVADRLSNLTRDEDTVSRLGGDEFIVMIEHLAKDEAAAMTEANEIGNKIVSTLNQPYILDDFTYDSSSSVGVTLFYSTEKSVEILLSQADTAMYAAKNAGRNTLHFFGSALQEAMEKRISDERALRQALVDEQFELYYQIQVDRNGQSEGAEALIRWGHPSKGLMLPSSFIPLAEEAHIIEEIGYWVIETACKQLKKWQDDDLAKHLVLAINISILQFQKDDFIDELLRVVQENDVHPDKLKIELTETVVLQDVELAIEKMTQLKALGICVAMDDFGTGYSSLNYISRLPVDQIKIDRSFVSRALNSEHDVLIIRMVITLGRMLNISVVAEGIETYLQYRLLHNMGCKHYQGYYFGKPMPIDKFNMLLKHDLLSISETQKVDLKVSPTMDINY